MTKILHRTEAYVYDHLPQGTLKEQMLSHAEDLRFVMVGGLGFSVNLVALWLLHGQLGLAIFPAQLLSGELALLSNFVFHHSWTYQDYAHGSLGSRLAKFHASGWTGVLIGTVIVWFATNILHIFYLLALVIAAALSLAWNYTMNKRVIWAKSKPSSINT